MNLKQFIELASCVLILGWACYCFFNKGRKP